MKRYNINPFLAFVVILVVALLFGDLSCKMRSPLARSRKPALVVNVSEDPYITRDGNVEISGTVRSRRIKQVEFVLRDSNGEETTPCDPVIPNNDRSFESSFQLDNPGNYVLTVRVPGQESGVDINIAYPSPPKFFINNVPQPDNYTLQIKEEDKNKINIEVRDEDGDLDKVVVGTGKREFPVDNNKLWKLKSFPSDMGKRIPIVAIDKQDNIAKLTLIMTSSNIAKFPVAKVPDEETAEPKRVESSNDKGKTPQQPLPPSDKIPPVFVYNDSEQPNGTTVILKVNERSEIKVKDNVLIREIDGKVINTNEYVIDTSILKEGFITVIAKDTSGNLARLNIVKDKTTPTFEVKGPIVKQVGNKLFLKDGDDLKLEFKDNYRLSRVILNNEEIKDNIGEMIVSSGKLRSENKIDVYDMSNNILTLNVVK